MVREPGWSGILSRQVWDTRYASIVHRVVSMRHADCLLQNLLVAETILRDLKFREKEKLPIPPCRCEAVHDIPRSLVRRQRQPAVAAVPHAAAQAVPAAGQQQDDAAGNPAATERTPIARQAAARLQQ